MVRYDDILFLRADMEEDTVLYGVTYLIVPVQPRSSSYGKRKRHQMRK